VNKRRTGYSEEVGNKKCFDRSDDGARNKNCESISPAVEKAENEGDIDTDKEKETLDIGHDFET